MEWNHLIYFALPAVFCWGMGAMAAYRPGKSLQVVLWTVAGLAIFMAFIVIFIVFIMLFLFPDPDLDSFRS